ncbi:EF-hand domain-containing protein [Sphingomonas sp. MMS24-JH45]
MKTILLAAAALAVSGTAVAQMPARAPIVTRAEAMAKADQRFQQMDANRDGKVGAEERRAWREAKRDQRPGRELTQPVSASARRSASTGSTPIATARSTRRSARPRA